MPRIAAMLKREAERAKREANPRPRPPTTPGPARTNAPPGVAYLRPPGVARTVSGFDLLSDSAPVPRPPVCPKFPGFPQTWET